MTYENLFLKILKKINAFRYTQMHQNAFNM